MIQNYRNRMAMMATTQQYLQTNKAVWADNKPFAKNVETLIAITAEATAAGEGQTPTSTGTTEDKHALESQALDAVVYIAKSTKAYALDQDDNELRAAVSFSRSTLHALDEGALVNRLRSIVAKAQAKATELEEYGVTKDHIARAIKAIDAFEKAQPNPRATIAERSVHTDSLSGIMKRSRRVLEHLDSLVHIFDEKNPSFSAGYKAARVVVDAGTRHEKPMEG